MGMNVTYRSTDLRVTVIRIAVSGVQCEHIPIKHSNFAVGHISSWFMDVSCASTHGPTPIVILSVLLVMDSTFGSWYMSDVSSLESS